MSVPTLARIALLAVIVTEPVVAGSLSAPAGKDSSIAIWSQAQYGDARQNRRAGLSEYDVTVKGAAVGMVGQVSEAWSLGFSYRALEAELQERDRSTLRVDGEFLKATAGFVQDRYAFDLGLSHGRTEHNHRWPASDDTGTVLGADALLGYRYPLQGTVVVEPLLQLRYVRAESDESQPLQEIGEVGIGVRWTGHFQAGPGRLEQRIRLMALRDYIADPYGTTTLVMLGDQAVVTHPARPQRHSYQAGLGMSYYLGGLVLSAGYDYLERSNYYADNLSVEVRYDF